MEQIHVLYLIDVLYSRHGGAEGVLWNMTRLLPKDRYRCSIATFSANPGAVIVNAFDCPVHLLPLRRTYDWQALKTAARLRRLIRSEGVSIVHTFFAASDLFGSLVAKLSGCPVLISSRRDMGFQRLPAQKVAYRVAARMFDQVQTVSEAARIWHMQHDHLEPAKVVTVYNGVELAAIGNNGRDHLADERCGGGAEQLVVCVANIRRVKALDVLVRTAATVCQELPRTRFLVVGAVQDWAYMRELRDLSQRLHVAENVVFVGQRPGVPAILRQCDVFFLPSHSEGLSNAMLEAMACSLPCVATAVGGNPELIEEGASGFLVPPGDAGVAAERLLYLLRNKQLADRMGQTGRRMAQEKFSLEAMMARLTEQYENLLARRGMPCIATSGPSPSGVRPLLQ